MTGNYIENCAYFLKVPTDNRIWDDDRLCYTKIDSAEPLSGDTTSVIVPNLYIPDGDPIRSTREVAVYGYCKGYKTFDKRLTVNIQVIMIIRKPIVF